MSKHLERYNLESLLELCVRKPNHSFFRTGPTTPNLVPTIYHQRAEFPFKLIFTFFLFYPLLICNDVIIL